MIVVRYYVTPPHDSGGVLWFHVGYLCVHPSVHQSVVHPSVHPYFHFQTITWVNINGFSPNLICCYCGGGGLGLFMGKFHQFLTNLPAMLTCFPFLDDNFSKYQWIFTKLGICIDIVEIWFGIFIIFWQSYLLATCPYFYFRMITSVNVNVFSRNLVWALILWRSALGLQILLIFACNSILVSG